MSGTDVHSAVQRIGRRSSIFVPTILIPTGCALGAVAGTCGAVIGYVVLGQPDFYFRSVEGALLVVAPTWGVYAFVVGFVPAVLVGMACRSRGRRVRVRPLLAWSIVIGFFVGGGLKTLEIAMEDWILGGLAADAATLILISLVAAGSTEPIPVAPCPKCNYDLRGELDKGCSECGWGREPQ